MEKKILVVEDEPSIADNITYALSTEGFEPEWCPTGKDTLEALKKHDAVMVILDVGLPDINGFELAREILRDYEVPIIFVTARADEIDRIVGLEIGADDYVVKPFSPRELTARVKAVLRRVSSVSRNEQEYTGKGAVGIEVDEERHRITFHDEVIDLSRYEYRILSILASRPGRVYSREQLMRLAWEEPEMSLDRTVDTHIKTIRQKLRAIRPDEDPIVTHRGVGYSLKEG